MKSFIRTAVSSAITGVVALSLASASLTAYAQQGASEASAFSAAIPVAVVTSIGVGASATAGVATSAAAGASASVVAVPLALSVGGATLVVKSVEASATGMICVLERVSDGARVSIQIAHRDAAKFSAAVGTTVSVSVMASGILLVKAGEAMVYIPNALGRALSHNERL
jgi:hypothetical protein